MNFMMKPKFLFCRNLKIFKIFKIFKILTKHGGVIFGKSIL